MMNYIILGKIVNTHGIKGELKVQSYSDFDAIRYKKGNTVYIAFEDTYLPMKVSSFRVHKGFSLVSFEGAQDINAVEKYKDCYLYMNANDRHVLADGEYYRDQLIGLTALDEENQVIGIVTAVEETCPSQTHLRIQRRDAADALVPYIPFFVKRVDLKEKILVIHKEEGLL